MKGEDLPKKKKKERKKKKKKKERRSIEKKKIPTVSFFCNGQFRFQESFGSAGFDFLNLGDHDRGGIDALPQKRTCLSFILIILSLDHDADNGQTNRVHEGTSSHSGDPRPPREDATTDYPEHLQDSWKVAQLSQLSYTLSAPSCGISSTGGKWKIVKDILTTAGS